jgi:hypothetical protein
MKDNDALQQNVRRTTAQHALKRTRAIVDEENRNDAAAARSLRWLLRYGWLVLLAVVALLARLTGVY